MMKVVRGLVFLLLIGLTHVCAFFGGLIYEDHYAPIKVKQVSIEKPRPETPMEFKEGVIERIVTVDRALDGDTLRLKSGEQIELMWVDTPELKTRSKPDQHYARKAWKFVDDSVSGKDIRIVYAQSGRDRDGRPIAFAFLPSEELLNREIIIWGYGFVSLNYPAANEEWKPLFIAQKIAMDSAVGLWEDPIRLERLLGQKGLAKKEVPKPHKLTYREEYDALWEDYQIEKQAVSAISDFARVSVCLVPVSRSSQGGGTYSGFGSQAVGPCFLTGGIHTVYSSYEGQGNFIVTLLDHHGELCDLLANEVGRSESSRAFSVGYDGEFVINVESEGRWRIKID